MTVNNNVFASRSERENYYKLKRTWGDNYIIYHNLPFLNVFNTYDLIDFTTDRMNPIPIQVADIDINRLKKTSIDFTLCDLQDHPILCIEFDGIQQGFNVGTIYYPMKLSKPVNPWRRQITELKLTVALGSRFPFFVVGSKQFNDISREIKLTIVDGIIGTILASKGSIDKISKGFDPEVIGWARSDFDNLSSQEQYEIMQNWVWDVEIDQEFEFNPISRSRANLEMELGVMGFKLENLTYPPIDENSTIKERSLALENAIYYGSRITLHTQDFGEIQEESWIPNFKVGYFSPYQLNEDIASLYALKKLKRLRTKKAKKAKKE